VLGGRRAILGGALAMLGGARNDLDAKIRPAAGALTLIVTLRHRQIARVGGQVSRHRGKITRIRRCVALVYGV
jgi:hypothetical protein